PRSAHGPGGTGGGDRRAGAENVLAGVATARVGAGAGAASRSRGIGRPGRGGEDARLAARPRREAAEDREGHGERDHQQAPPRADLQAAGGGGARSARRGESGALRARGRGTAAGGRRSIERRGDGGGGSGESR